MRARLLVLAPIFAACGTEWASIDDVPADTYDKAPAQLWQSLAARQPRSFLLAIAAGDDTGGAAAVRARKARVRADLRAGGAAAVERDWDQLPIVQVRADSLDAAAALLDRDEVVSAHEIARYELSDAQSFPLIGQPAVAAAGRTGAGTSVAVLDTGVDYTRADFGCTAPGVPSSCRVAFAQDFAPGDGALDANGHGSNVAGIVAGVAPGTKILALDVFTGDGASTTDILSAINWTIANRAAYRIAAMNLSLGGGGSSAPCTSDVLGVALATARAAGIAPVVAAGNNGYTSALSAPACAPAAISVGAVYDSNVGGLAYGNCRDLATAADQLACFSNSASFLSLLAPGALITAAGSTMAGTSQAAPHVAGALAVLRASFAGETVDQLVARLVVTGKPIRDPRNGITKPRIDLAAAVRAAPADVAPPTGSVLINGGAAFTRTPAITLAITASDPSGVRYMCVTDGASCTSFVPFAAATALTLGAGDGRKTVTVVLRDGVGNTTVFASSPRAAISLDTTAPSNGTVSLVAGSGVLTAAWSGFADAGSGLAGYRVMVAAGSAAPACGDRPYYSGTASTVRITGLSSGRAYSVRVCAVDGVGLLSSGAVASATVK